MTRNQRRRATQMARVRQAEENRLTRLDQEGREDLTRRFVVDECCQPGSTGRYDDWKDIASFDDKNDAIFFALNHGHFMSRDVFDSKKNERVFIGWRLED